MKSRLLPLAILLCVPLLSIAQTEATDEAEPIPFYDVEVVLFKNLQGPRGVEFARPTSLPARTDDIIDIQSIDSASAASETGFSLLQQDDLRLIDQADKIVESSRYELMLHTAWRQPGLDFEQSIPVWVRGGKLFGSEYSSIDFKPQNEYTASQIADSIESSGQLPGAENNALSVEQRELDSVLNEQTTLDESSEETANNGLHELEGLITVSLSRYLHVDADLIIRKPRPVGSTQAGFYNNQNSNIADSRILENHRLQERRRMRSATLHYLDNPQFAMLVIISPVEATDENQAAAAVTPLTE